MFEARSLMQYSARGKIRFPLVTLFPIKTEKSNKIDHSNRNCLPGNRPRRIEVIFSFIMGFLPFYPIIVISIRLVRQGKLLGWFFFIHMLTDNRATINTGELVYVYVFVYVFYPMSSQSTSQSQQQFSYIYSSME